VLAIVVHALCVNSLAGILEYYISFIAFYRHWFTGNWSWWLAYSSSFWICTGNEIFHLLSSWTDMPFCTAFIKW